MRDKGAKADDGDDNVNRMQGEATKNAEVNAQQEDSHFNVRCAAHGFSKDPRAQLEAAVETLAAQMREYPTLPSEVHDASLPRIEAFRDDTAPQLPPKHCAFKSCPWELSWDATANAGTERGREKKLVEHILETHYASIHPVAQNLPHCFSLSDRVAAAYNEAIGHKVRSGAPLASYAIDRRSLRKASEAMSGDNVEALICFFCACIYPHRAGAINQRIEWRKPRRADSPELFFRYGVDYAESHLSIDAYLKNYGRDVDGFFDLNHHRAEFDDWELNVPFGSKVVSLLSLFRPFAIFI